MNGLHPNHTKVSEQYLEHLEWVFQDGVPAWERFGIQRVVSMAACIVEGHLILGNRHFCPLMNQTIQLLDLQEGTHDISVDQGFVDQWGVWMSRKEAWDVAKSAGQIKKVFQEGVLFSECYL